MRSLLLFMLAAILSVPAYSQLNCSTVNAALSLSASGGVVTLTNSSVPTATSTIYTYYTIKWGDNSITYANNNTAQVHTYNTSGTYTVTLYSQVLDSVFNVTCNDTATANITVTTSLNCSNVNAVMYAYVSGASTGVVVNNSVPIAGPRLSVQYVIKWGDGNTTNTSSKSNQTHVYTSNGTYPVQLLVKVIDSNNSITCLDSMADTITITGSSVLNCSTVKAAFSKTVSGNMVTLTNNSTPNPGSGINASYKFSWGNGNTTTKTNKTSTSYTYPTSGTYTIWLVATYTSGSLTCKDSTSDTVTIAPPPNKIAGRIWVDSTSSLDTYKVWLIKFDSATNILSAVDSQKVVTIGGMGNYAFMSKAAGQYRTKAARHNGPTSGTGYVPTYHDSSLLWSSAVVINHSGSSTINRDIYMRKGTLTSGPGFVGGNVSSGANKGTANGIEGINILLLDANSDVVAYAVTDVNGDYSFSNLPNANYTVHPEDLGYATSAATLIVTVGQPVHNGINFERSLSQKTISPKATGINNINSKQLAFVIYPNPATDVVNINWADYTDDAATITITDISGKKVYNTEVRMNANAVISISELQTGFYFLNVATEFGTNTHKLIVQ